MLEFDLQIFGGRGASSASGGGGAAPQADDTLQAQPMGASYSEFMGMTDDEKADFIDRAISQDVPVFLADNDFQKFTYNSKMNDKPQLVDDAVLDSMNGTEIFRTVNNVYNKRTDISYKADEIAAQVTKGSVTRVSDTGGSVYGRGIYFAEGYSRSTVYGSTRGNIQKSAVIRGKLNSNAKIISYSQATSGMQREISSGSKLGRSLARMDSKSAASVYALSKGYNVISSGHGYLNILNRNAVTMSTTVKAVGNKW